MTDLSWVSEKATGILIPSGYKAGKLYGIVPDNQYTTGIPKNAFDFTTSRNSLANRTNSAGVWESMENDVPLLDYSGGPCPVELLQTARTNLFLNSDAGVTQTITVVSGSVYSMYFTSGSGTITLSGADTSVLSVSDHQYSGSVTFMAASTSLVCTVAGVANEVQCELSPYSTTYIKTTLASAIRAADALNLTGLTTNGILGSDEATIFFDLGEMNNTGSASGNLLFSAKDGTANDNNFGIITNNSSDHQIKLRLNSVTQYNVKHGPLIKASVSLSQSKRSLAIDGVIVYTDTTAYNGLLDIIKNDTGHASLINIEQIQAYNNALTDQELIELTS